MFFKSVELSSFVCLHQSSASWRPVSESPPHAGTRHSVTVTHYSSSSRYLSHVFQGPLEKSLQNSMVSERQRNIEHKVSAIKNSAQVFFLILFAVYAAVIFIHTWTIIKMCCTNSFDDKLHQPASILLRTSVQTSYSGHTCMLRFSQLLWVQCESSLF